MLVKPLHDNIVVELEPVKEFSRGGIIKVAPELVRIGRVLSVGPGKFYAEGNRGKGTFIPTELKKGDRIAFFQAVTQTQQGQQLRYKLPENQVLLRETDALFIIPEGLDIEVTR